MKKITVSIVTMLAALTLTTSPLLAAGYGTSAEKSGSASSQATSQSQSMSQANSQSAEKILGMQVMSKDGEKVGEIQDIKIDPQSGRVNYVTVQKGGVMGIGGQEGIPVPLQALQFTSDNARLMVDKSKLDNAPRQGNMSQQQFERDLQSHYGISPTWQGGQSGGGTMSPESGTGSSGSMQNQHQKNQ